MWAAHLHTLLPFDNTKMQQEIPLAKDKKQAL